MFLDLSTNILCAQHTMTQTAAATQRANDVDKGWAWLVLVAVYSGIFLLSTSILMCGVIFFALLTYYGKNAAMTSVIGSLNSGLMNLLGPLVSIVMDTYSCRTSMLIGAILVTSSYVASAFVQNIDLLIFIFGVLGGGSNSLMTPITLDFVDEDRISDAHGLEFFFCGLGYITGPPIAGYMFEVTSSYHYSVMMSGAVLILGCILAVAGAYLLRRQKCRQEDNIDDATELSEQQQHLFIPGHVKRNDFKEV
ncbi:monocarboxylate transporter 14-like isoform X10 [Dreissena polymorpha]|uniref:monocarboxylate transporter 14-like isoform X10 n=1 Tax=Dreissena polymorpha TaxID=45954 RepID=UPI0022645FE3|nr:monocarboxylate transporter 14-like isoform X10 [Dreissena polymorpha]